MELLKLLNANQILAQIISFLIMFFLLRIYAWRPLLRLLDQRRERITSEYKKIEDLQSGLAKTQSEYRAKLEAIEETARGRIQEAVHEGKKIASEIRAKARDDAHVIVEEAKGNIQLEIAKAKEEIKNTIVDLTVVATEKMLKEKMTAEKDKALIKGFLDDMEDMK